MSLSTGTLNLKFMQRAAARAVKSEPTRPSPSASAGTSIPGSPAPAQAPPTPAAVSTPAREATTTAATIKAEDEAEAAAKWVLPRRSNAEAGPSTRPRVEFVASYMPFLEDDESGSTMAPGRLTFGRPAEAEEPPSKTGGGDDDDGEFMSEDSDSEDEVEVRRKAKGKARVRWMTHTIPRLQSI